MFYRFADGVTSSRRIIIDDVEVEVFGVLDGGEIRSRVEWHAVNVLLAGDGISTATIVDHGEPERHPRPVGSLYFIPSCSHVHVKTHGSGAVYATIRISPTVFYRVANEALAGSSAPARVVQPFFDAEMIQVARGMVDAAAEPLTAAIDIISTRASALAAMLMRRMSGDRERLLFPGGLSAERRVRVVEMVKARLAEPIELEDMAEAAGLSPDRFRHAFKVSFGITPHRYLMAERIKLAQDLLAKSDDPLADVALASGFGSQAHFTTVFRDFVGITPGAYRKTRRA